MHGRSGHCHVRRCCVAASYTKLLGGVTTTSCACVCCVCVVEGNCTHFWERQALRAERKEFKEKSSVAEHSNCVRAITSLASLDVTDVRCGHVVLCSPVSQYNLYTPVQVAGRCSSSYPQYSHDLCRAQILLRGAQLSFELCPSSGLNIKNNIKITTFRKLVRLPSSGDGRRDTYSVGSFWPS